ncbi:TPA: DNA mismatch repair protein MutS [Bacillus anthracis]|uniref:DNA mismatch repair protein MutS n=1 Tax=Bacillus cereus group TaxID=86661 RepID=UPI0001DBF44D|nr:DNA mismatch repair protein MutS [Bacillus cereus]MDR4320367.1 DNA mismatch repair protein MutS [Bacillus paranthracis]HDR4494396.1 DNA mismatch repair protein MutS [Bacillus cereus biovar anthracis]ADK06332.1 DNA mismatch repair protein [Bacillus cereus biovar anthracis str. CI]EJQ97147.1 DNA mismatch repair protein mutS [Bacillus cereus ISP3191]HDR6226686.1 DNA mismatch repair protein MutS [Bacillus cereus biovar anthracis]
MTQYTPMIQQYLKVKADYQDAFLFFRLGDFYEMFFEDAVKAAHELEITLTSRDGGSSERIPMCGVPYHAAKNYIEQLVEKGYKVAVCEQVEDPKTAKGVVRREVVQLITPGTMMEGRTIDEKENNFLAALTHFEDGSYALACNDLTTGQNTVTLLTGSVEDILLEVYATGSKEIVVDSSFSKDELNKLTETLKMTISYEDATAIPEGLEHLVKNVSQAKLIKAVGRLFNYVIRTQKRSLDHLQPVEIYYTNQFMKIDVHSKRNLELTETLRTKEKTGSLLWLLDKTKTAMGGRMLKQWMERPLIQKERIEERLEMVETFVNDYFLREDLKEKLKEVYDLERLAGKVAFGNVNARDLLQLRRSLLQVPAILEAISLLDNAYAARLIQGADPCESLTELLGRSIQENPPLSIKDGDIIKDGYNDKLDQYRYVSKNGKTWIAELEKRERDITGIKSLKIGYNRIFGYYIEVTKANLGALPEGRYERKQTLANAERFITDELKEKETLILEAEEKIVQLEYDLFTALREEVKVFIPKLQHLAKVISELDVLQSFATVSEEEQFVKPVLTTKREIFIKDGRHPVVEKVLNGKLYVPNDCIMPEKMDVFLITGPNMSGKSTYMRQLALVTVMSQIGCFVPATEAVLPVFDQIFTRIGAADDLISGQSTFMVEMLEAKNAIANASERSLILFDEIGRGTSTYDGMALAQAIIEHIHDQIGAKTLFSTHYHELTVLEESLDQLKNVHVSAIEENGKVVFLHKIQDGAADKSYGIHVAQLAELPDSLIARAKEVLAQLEGQEDIVIPKRVEVKAQEQEVIPEPVVVKEEPVEIEETKVENEEESQLSFFGTEQSSKKQDKPVLDAKETAVLAQIKKIDLLDMTPLEAMNELYRLQKKLKKG